MAGGGRWLCKTQMCDLVVATERTCAGCTAPGPSRRFWGLIERSAVEGITGPRHPIEVGLETLVRGSADPRVWRDDIGESGIALVLAVGRFAQPWTVELYNAPGGLLRSHPFHGGRPS
jgi:hypothetical protein